MINGILRTDIELRDPKSLKPYEKNNKKHPPEQIEHLKKAIVEHGFDQPIVVDSHGVIIKGHARREASIELGLKKVPVIVADDLTPEQVRSARLADNTIPNQAEIDFDAIKFELEELSDLGYDLSLTGFDDAELDQLLSDIPTTEYQPPEYVGVGEQETEPEPVQPPVGDKYPLAIVLDSGYLKKWQSRKERLGEKKDLNAFKKLLDSE